MAVPPLPGSTPLAASAVFEKIAALLTIGGGAFAYVGTFFLLFLAGWAVPLPEEATVIAAGYVTKKNGLSLPLMFVCVIAGILCGDLMIFRIGRKHGDWVFRLRLFRWMLPEERLRRARRLFAEHGSKVAFFGRFIAGIRLVIFFTAGNLGVPVTTFLFYDFLATLLTIPIGLFAGYYFADRIDQAFEYAKRLEGGVFLLIAAVVVFFLVERWIKRRLEARRLKREAAAAGTGPAGDPASSARTSAVGAENAS